MSVLLPVRDGESYLATALDSILSQTFADFELIAVDDGSTDSTATLLAARAREDPRVRVVTLPPSGQAAAMNVGAALARGAYLARMDADDECEAHRFARQVDFLDARPEVVVVGTQFTLIGPSGEPLGESLHPQASDDIRAALKRHVCAIGHPTVMLRREVFLRAGGYRDYFAPAEDYDLWLRMSELGELANLGESLLRYRVHSGALSSRRSLRQAYSVLSAAHAWRESLVLDLPMHSDGRHHTRERLRRLGVPDEVVEAVTRGAFAWQLPLLAKTTDVEEFRRLLNAVTADDAMPVPLADMCVMAAQALAAAGRGELALEVLEQAAGPEAPPSPRLDLMRETVAAELAQPLRAILVTPGASAQPDSGAPAVDAEPPAAAPMPQGVGAIDAVRPSRDGRRIAIVGWGELRAGRAGYVLELGSPVPGRILSVARTLRTDVADAVGGLLLASGFEVDVDFGDGVAPSPDAIEVRLRSPEDVVRRLARHVPPNPGTAGASPDGEAAPAGLWRLPSAPAPRLGPFDVGCFMVVRNEVDLLPHSLAAQRALGVRHFFVVDNDSTDGTAEWLARQPDVTAFRSASSFAESNFGLRWIEALLDRHARDRWALVLDADESFVYPGYEHLSIGELARFLSRSDHDAVGAVVVDMYSEHALAETDPQACASLLELCPYFDGSGYFVLEAGAGRTLVRGGPRARLFWPEYSTTLARRQRAAALSWNEAAYLADHPDVADLVGAESFASGWDHLLRCGRFEGRRLRPTPHPTWDEAEYRQQNPDVDAAIECGVFASGLEHYLLHGQFEGRSAEAPPLLTVVPLLHWRSGRRFGVSRHSLEGDPPVSLSPLGAGVLHFKLLRRLASRADEELLRKQHWQEGREYVRYAEVLRRSPELTAFCDLSVPFTGSRQLELLGLLRGTPALQRFAGAVAAAGVRATGR